MSNYRGDVWLELTYNQRIHLRILVRILLAHQCTPDGSPCATYLLSSLLRNQSRPPYFRQGFKLILLKKLTTVASPTCATWFNGESALKYTSASHSEIDGHAEIEEFFLITNPRTAVQISHGIKATMDVTDQQREWDTHICVLHAAAVPEAFQIYPTLLWLMRRKAWALRLRTSYSVLRNSYSLLRTGK